MACRRVSAERRDPPLRDRFDVAVGDDHGARRARLRDVLQHALEAGAARRAGLQHAALDHGRHHLRAERPERPADPRRQVAEQRDDQRHLGVHRARHVEVDLRASLGPRGGRRPLGLGQERRPRRAQERPPVGRRQHRQARAHRHRGARRSPAPARGACAARPACVAFQSASAACFGFTSSSYGFAPGPALRQMPPPFISRRARSSARSSASGSGSSSAWLPSRRSDVRCRVRRRRASSGPAPAARCRRRAPSPGTARPRPATTAARPLRRDDSGSSTWSTRACVIGRSSAIRPGASP